MSDPSAEPLFVVALSGVAESGKDTTARFLVANHGFSRLSLSDPIRMAFECMSGPQWDCHKELAKAEKSLRWMMQTLGDESRTEAGCPDVYTDLASTAIRYFAFHHPALRRRFVIPDCRRAGESDLIGSRVRSWGGHFETWKVHRPLHPAIAESAHSSETSVAGVTGDRNLWNRGTKADLSALIDDALAFSLAGADRG